MLKFLIEVYAFIARHISGREFSGFLILKTIHITYGAVKPNIEEEKVKADTVSRDEKGNVRHWSCPSLDT